jgi:hypothetical protein
MEGVFVGYDGNVIIVVKVVAITTRFNYNNIFATHLWVFLDVQWVMIGSTYHLVVSSFHAVEIGCCPLF